MEQIIAKLGKSVNDRFIFKLNSEKQIEKISKILIDEGKTIVNINLVSENNILKFKLKNSRKLDRKTLNLIRNEEIQAIIS